MASPTKLQGDVQVLGHFTPQTMTVPAGAVSNAGIAANAGIAGSKMKHRFRVRLEQDRTAAVVAGTKLVFHASAVAVINHIKASVDTIATGADRTVTVDLKKRSGAAAWASIMSSVITLDDGSTDNTEVEGSLASSALVAGDKLELIVAVAGAAGNQAKGLYVEVEIEENPS